jgi:hypothetical protein
MIYRVAGKIVQILSIVHGSRDLTSLEDEIHDREMI